MLQEELWFDGHPLNASSPTIGQFLHHIENLADFSDEERREYAIDHLISSPKKFIKYNAGVKWQDLRKILFQKYRLKLSIKEKLELLKSLVQLDDESIELFYNRCVKCQYVIQDDVEDLIFENDILFRFVIGLKDHIYQQLILKDNLNSLYECYKIAQEVEKDLQLTNNEAKSSPVKVEVVTVKNEPVNDDFDNDFKQELAVLSHEDQDFDDNSFAEPIDDDFGNDVKQDFPTLSHEDQDFEDNAIADDHFENEYTYSPKPKRVRKSVQENTAEESDDYFEYSDQSDNEEEFEFSESREKSYSSESRKQCKICGKNFALLNDLHKHMAVEHNQNAWQCKYCPSKYFSDKRNLRAHLKTQHNEGVEMVRCEFCKTPKSKKVMRKPWANAIHIGLMHPKVNPDNGKLICQLCEDSQDFRPNGLEVHIKL